MAPPPSPQSGPDAPSTIVVVPCYNEARRLNRGAFERYAAGHAHLMFLFVNDGSSDGTAELLADMATRHPDRFAVLELGHNEGKGEAVRRGVLAALERSPALVGYWDADLATPLNDIGTFEQILGNHARCLMVLGSRVNLLGRNVRRHLLRHYVGRLFATGAAALLRLGVYDTQCGAKLFRASTIVRNCFEHPFLSRWVFDVEILARLRAGWNCATQGTFRGTIIEHPLMVWTDVRGSKIRPADFPGVTIDLVRMTLRYARVIARNDAAERRQG